MGERGIDREAAARAIEDFLRALGHDPEAGDLRGTGARVAEAWGDDLLAGQRMSPREILAASAIETEGRVGVVALRNLAVTTMCPHHLLPAFGTALVAYLPGARVAGIGQIAQVVDAVARRLTLQERIGTEVADLLVAELGARGALCALTLTHTCLVARGERQAGAIVETIAFAGSFSASGEDRDVALSCLGSRG